jgi:hypothetical protein
MNFLKLGVSFISSPLHHTFHKSSTSGIFLVSNIPLQNHHLEKGNRNNKINYRPTSLLTSFSKALENIICGRLLHHINTNNILVNEQFGFQTKSSTEKAFFKLLNDKL